MQLTIPTNEDIRNIVHDVLTEFFSSYKFQPQTEIDEIGGVEFASKIINKAVPTIYDLVNKRLIPHSKQGKQLYFSKRELLDWLKAGKRKTHSELALEAETFNPKTTTRRSIITRRP